MKHAYYKVTWKQGSHIGKPFTYYREVERRDFFDPHIEILDLDNPHRRKDYYWSSTVFKNSNGLKSHAESIKVEEVNEDEINDFILQLNMMKELAK